MLYYKKGASPERSGMAVAHSSRDFSDALGDHADGRRGRLSLGGMIMQRTLSGLIVLVIIFGVTVTLAEANPYPGTQNLYDRGLDVLGHRLIYDADLNITWYDFTKTTQDNWQDIWQNQMDWAASLEVTIAGQTFTDWRLPTTQDRTGLSGWGYDGTTWGGYNITASEMGHLYYEELGNKGYYATDGTLNSDYGVQNSGPFTDLLSFHTTEVDSLYWSASEYECPDDHGCAYQFSLGVGSQLGRPKNFGGFAIAVRDGDVAPVPEPSTLLITLSGFATWGAMTWRRHRRR